MTLSDIAAGIETTTEQRRRGVATVEDTDADLVDRLAEHDEALPCDPDEAATVLETYVGGASVGSAGHEAGVAPVTAAKTLHLLGVSGVTPLAPRARQVVRDWLDAELSRADARALTGASEAAFALAAFVESHDPIEGVEGIVESVRADDGDAAVDKRDALGETMSDVGDLL